MDDGVDKVLEESSERAAQKALINKDSEDIITPDAEGKDSFGIPVLETSWQSLKITSKIDDEEVVQDVSALSPVKVQFLLRNWYKQIQDTLKARQIELDLDKSTFENIYIKNMSPNREKSQDVIHAAINALEEKLDQIVIRSLRISAEKQTQMLLATVYTPGIAAKNVAIYKQGHYGICFVGLKDGVLQTYDVMNSIVTTNSPCARQVRINNFYAELLTKLGFIEYVNDSCSSKIEISIDTNNQIILMNKAFVRDVHYVVEKIQAFRKCVVKTEYNSAPSKIALLRLNETKKRVDGILRRENVLCFVDICNESDSGHIYTRTEEEGKNAVMILETSLQEITVRISFVKSKNFEQILIKFPGEILILYSESKYTCRITCTNDALADISVALVKVDHPDETKTLGNTQKKKAFEQVGYEESDRKPKQVQKKKPDANVDFGDLSTRYTKERNKFVTKEGIDIYVYSESILQLDVDCIVNSANERLSHGAGVAGVIARAAGYELEREGKDYIRQHGEIPVGECCHTTAGKLPYKYVIHTVGPRWNNNMTFDEQTQCKNELQNAVESCFYGADELGMRSIGVPSVGAGIFGMPPYICAKQYCEAVINYSQQRTWKPKSTTLKEIHFIDMNVDMCRQIADVFSKCGELSGTEAGLSGGSKPSISRHYFSKSSYSQSLSHGSYDSPSLQHGSYDS